MAIKFNVKVFQCEVCGHRWLPEGTGAPPAQCPSRQCRSRRWNENEVIIDDEDDDVPIRQASPAPAVESPVDLFARLGLTTASQLHSKASQPLQEPADDIEPALPMCAYQEYDPESGETYRCGLRQHSYKVKHTRGHRI